MAEKIKITKRTVDALKPENARYTAWDNDLPGFGVRVGPNGCKSYIMKYRVGGGRTGRIRWGVIGQHGALTPIQARDIAQRWAAEIAAGGDPAGKKIEKLKNPNVSELMDQYLESHIAAQSEPPPSSVVAGHIARSFWLSGHVIECKLLSGLNVRHFQKSRAGMVISGSGPNLTHELCCSAGRTGFPNPDLFDHFAHSSHSLLTPPAPSPAARHKHHAVPASAGSL